MDHYEGFHEFVRTRQQSLMRTAYLLTGNPHLAEDLLQTVLTRVASHWAKLAKDGNPEAYARKALVNQAISWRRRKRVELPGAELPEPAESGQHDEATVRRLALRNALAKLTPKQRAVIVLRFYEDRSEHETAQLMGVSIGTVKSQTSYALSKLRALTPKEVYR
ncbi:RNA polymerase sigma factor [Sphaerisporangium krabiense]|uniref:RNA polymerase sigma-70 factor (Sigma-E family) n=1 Tax=Sphaerisporangium krabiense TaxID=763782 RepID=A0A7W8ZCL5_9ACTN|nr:SigE family RNA polymerase sigma factor [Sphaerisporangium krabiense]MBB5631534.1 RNA polymerase sigma-70 factor (sigma-E family) [Sphaerisporangium krabiense]GII60948.1 RNA polymerase sigma factor [Sphaerisporangium krabiense]